MAEAASSPVPIDRSKQTVVFSHGPCPDGYTAAWAYWRTLPLETREALSKFGGFYAKNAPPQPLDAPNPTGFEIAKSILESGFPVAFIFTNPTAKVDPELVRGRNILIFDLALELALETPICETAASVLVLDHHKTGKEIAEAVGKKFSHTGRVEVFYDMNRSAAKIVFDRFNPGQPDYLPAYIQDRDIWTWKLPNSKIISEAFYTGSYLDSFWDLEETHQRWITNKEELEAELIGVGSGAIKYQARLLQDLGRRAVPATMTATVDGKKQEYKVLIINSSTLASDLGNYIMEDIAPLWEKTYGFKADLAAIWSYKLKEDMIYCSLRTNRKDVDISKIARSIEGGQPGGGHPAAGAFGIQGDSIRKVFTFVRHSKYPQAPTPSYIPLVMLAFCGFTALAYHFAHKKSN